MCKPSFATERKAAEWGGGGRSARIKKIVKNANDMYGSGNVKNGITINFFVDLFERLGEDMKIYSTQILPPFYFKIKGCIILERIRPKIKDTMNSDSPYSGFR